MSAGTTGTRTRRRRSQGSVEVDSLPHGGLGGFSTRAATANLTAVRERTIRLGSRKIVATSILDEYWRFAVERQAIFAKRVLGLPQPWTLDPVLATYRFTNVYRAADRVSQFVIRKVIPNGDSAFTEVFFRVMLFKLFNRIETWEYLTERVGVPSWRDFRVERYEQLLDDAFTSGRRLYSAAYIIPPPRLGAERKHSNHLRLLQAMMDTGAPQRILEARSLSAAFFVLRSFSSIGDFLAYQFLIDLNYSPPLPFSEMEFIVAGPGAKSGIRKCFATTDGLSDADIIRLIADLASTEFERLGLRFTSLWGRPLQLIDCQNLFCEVDKYTRVAHPLVKGGSTRFRIKQRFRPKREPLVYEFPAKWGLDVTRALPGHWVLPERT